MSIKIFILIFLILLIINNSNSCKSESFTVSQHFKHKYNECLSSVVGRLYHKKKSLDESIKYFQGKDKKCLDKEVSETVKINIRKDWQKKADCLKFVNDIKNPKKEDEARWITTCLVPNFMK
jgi:hypothetical protein